MSGDENMVSIHPCGHVAALTLIVIGLALPLRAGAAGEASRGEELYESRCTGCHSLDANRIGPTHRGVYGRKAGSVADFEYSSAVKRSKIVWNDETLERWLTNPEKLIPGQKMGYQVPEAKDRADIVAYLKRESGKP
jgi:cytochrome c